MKTYLKKFLLVGVLVVSAASSAEPVSDHTGETVRLVAEQLMLKAQAAAFAQGFTCDCNAQTFIYRVSPSDPATVVAYPHLNLINSQAGAYAIGQKPLPRDKKC